MKKINVILSKIKNYYNTIGLKFLVFKIISYPYNKIKNKILEKKIFKFNNNKDVFTEIYNTNYWNDKDSRSGTGSSLKSTKNIRLQLPLIIERLNIKSVADIPCGDFQWFKKIIDNLEIDYFGGDLVDKLIIENKKYENTKVIFKQFDIINDKIPIVDLLICRDCLFHFSFEDIRKTFKNLKLSKFKYILITNHDLEKQNITNKQIRTGSFRLLDFHLSPFNFNKNYEQEILDIDFPRIHIDKKMLIYSKENFLLNIKNYINNVD